MCFTEIFSVSYPDLYVQYETMFNVSKGHLPSSTEERKGDTKIVTEHRRNDDGKLEKVLHLLVFILECLR